MTWFGIQICPACIVLALMLLQIRMTKRDVSIGMQKGMTSKVKALLLLRFSLIIVNQITEQAASVMTDTSLSSSVCTACKRKAWQAMNGSFAMLLFPAPSANSSQASPLALHSNFIGGWVK